MSFKAELSEKTIAKYQPVIGLEVHVQLQTKSKVFATETFAFGSKANTHISPISMAHPGALPQLNYNCVTHAIKAGLALDCEISTHTYFARKNYFYPDLPKGYQISQAENPICIEGSFEIPMPDGEVRSISIERIHIEEDAGKSIHDLSDYDTMIDLNRAGVGLIEIVTRPDFRTAEEAARFMGEMRKLVRYLGIGDGNMERGNLRCDANISVMPVGSTQYGTRVEIKNMNSMTQLTKAINYEIERQINLIEKGREVIQETRSWDTDKGHTLGMRTKETADDYRYFPEPDLQPLSISKEIITKIKAGLPVLPIERFTRYTSELGFSFKDAMALSEQKAFSDYFEQLTEALKDHRSAANWLMGSIKTYLNENAIEIDDFPLSPSRMAAMINLIKEDKISHTAAKETLFPVLLKQQDQDPYQLAKDLNILMESKSNEIEVFMVQLAEDFSAEVERYRKGKKGLMGFFVGKIMKHFQGKANPKEVNEVVRKILDDRS